MGRQINIAPKAPVMAQRNTKERNMSQLRWKLGNGKIRRYCNRTVVFIKVIEALYPSVEIQMSCVNSQNSVCESNMNARQTNLKNLGKFGEGKKVDVATVSKSGSCNFRYNRVISDGGVVVLLTYRLLILQLRISL